MLLVILFRLIGPLLILRYPLLGGILALTLDFQDLNILNFINQPATNNYQIWDKILDIYYLGLEGYISLTWKNKLVKYSAFSLLIYRFIGTIFFEITQKSLFLVIFPNVFEFFYLTYLLQLRLFKEDRLTSLKTIILVILVLTLPKLLQEYFLHINTTQPWIDNKYIKRIVDF